MLGAQEYALFTPREGAPSPLEGYRRGASGAFEVWPRDAQGRLWSAVLGLYLVVQAALVQVQTPEERLLLAPEQEAEARRREAVGRQEEAEARRRAEEEVERLRRELEYYRSQSDGSAGRVMAAPDKKAAPDRKEEKDTHG